MRQAQKVLRVQTHGQGLYEITEQTVQWVHAQGIGSGLLTVFCRHTSASLLIQENADPSATEDLKAFFRRLVPENAPWYTHKTEGPDDMPAHIKSALTSVSVGIPVVDGRPALGTWQGLYVFEHRAGRRDRSVVLSLLGA